MIPRKERNRAVTTIRVAKATTSPKRGRATIRNLSGSWEIGGRLQSELTLSQWREIFTEPKVAEEIVRRTGIQPTVLRDIAIDRVRERQELLEMRKWFLGNIFMSSVPAKERQEFRRAVNVWYQAIEHRRLFSDKNAIKAAKTITGTIKRTLPRFPMMNIEEYVLLQRVTVGMVP